MVFLQSIFGYLVLTINYKWTQDWNARGDSPPSILNMLIFMFLQPGTVNEPLFRNQAFIQVCLLLIALCCVPIMLFLKPFWLRFEHNKHCAVGYRSISDGRIASALDPEDEDHPSLTAHHDSRHSLDSVNNSGALIAEDMKEEEEFEFGEVLIHQVIHTIEYAQLSTVLWSMTVGNAFYFSGFLGVIAMFFLFAMWFNLTVAVLVVMEGTSAMLHSLRLHWVEAMSKVCS
ncbi:V0/A0 complex, 116-kDa subunit of ATPase [Terfezia boudieri ATCC MYA-4762]|uniref:V-type proton ATPase subunit a n=1 Tax=Terfezia boudieri ATCC MYA-4762 TaxID=1051890 RepID=A0A3N4M6U5_9PEZI|nr:V0/A0 complex, 116-kDa subunit of ATPase [Terfezia boudieri ATCC MYA-4762]